MADKSVDEMTRDELVSAIDDALAKAKAGAINPAGANVWAGRAQTYATLLVERALRDAG